MADATLKDRLAEICRRVIGHGGTVESLRRLTGGASQQIWSFEYGGVPLILRRSDGDDSVSTSQGLLGSEQEATLIDCLHAKGVMVPRVYTLLCPEDGIGTGFVMSRIQGEALPARLLKDDIYKPALDVFVSDCARELARIHNAGSVTINPPLPVRTPAERVRQLLEIYKMQDSPNAILAAALKWLRDHIPKSHAMTLVHGDFRMGNLLLEPTGISAVLDWELAHIGDPVFDLAYLCAPCWRFGRYDKPVGGVGHIEELLEAYEAASGTGVDRAHFDFWLVYSSTWWALTCRVMLGAWRNHEVRTLERAVIGTRVSENEIDLLLLLESLCGLESEAPIDWPADTMTDGAGATHTNELAIALGEWVDAELKPRFEGRDLFQARVAGNALGILERRTRLGPVYKGQKVRRLDALGLSNAELTAKLLDGRLGLSSPGILQHLRLTATEHVLIDQPRYAGLKVAKGKWTEPAA